MHKKDMCAGTFCCFHNPSDHKMVDWPMNLRTDEWAASLIERLCPHGVGHPDPDSVAFMEKAFPEGGGTWGVHGCDRCCIE